MDIKVLLYSFSLLQIFVDVTNTKSIIEVTLLVPPGSKDRVKAQLLNSQNQELSTIHFDKKNNKEKVPKNQNVLVAERVTHQLPNNGNFKIPTSTLMKKDQHNPSHGIYNPHSNHILHDADHNYINSLDGIDYLGSLENNDMNSNDYDSQDQDYYYTEDPDEYHSQVMNIENIITDDMHKIQSNNNILDDKTKIYGGQQTHNFLNESGDNTIRYHPKDFNSIDKSDHLLEPHSDTIKSFDFEERERDTDYVNDNIGFKHDENTNKENVDNKDNHPLHFETDKEKDYDDEVKKKGNCPEKKKKSMKRCVKVCRKGTCSTKCKQCKDGSCQEVSNQDLIDKIMELNKFS